MKIKCMMLTANFKNILKIRVRKRPLKTFEIKFEEKPAIKRTLLSGSKFREHSQESRMNPCVEINEHEDLREIKLPLKPKQLKELQENDTYCRDKEVT